MKPVKRWAMSAVEQLEPRRLMSDGTLTVNAVRTSAGSAMVSTATVSSESKLDLMNNKLITSSGATVTDVPSTFAGQIVNGNDTLVMYTWGGDANLSGNVDADDYFQIDSNYGRSGGAWAGRDFTYNGVIDGDDYTLIDKGFSYQNSPAAPAVYGADGNFTGNTRDDTFVVTARDGKVIVTINKQEFPTDARQLRINCNGGDDKVVIELADTDADIKITIDGGTGNDTLWGGVTAERIYGSEGDDLINGNGGKDTIYAQEGNDFLRGGGSSDLLDGGDGYDTVFGDAGNDNMCGGAQPDRLRGGDGNDRLDGNGGRDICGGEAGDDTLFGGGGQDVIHGGAGLDVLRGGPDHDEIFISDKDHDDFDFDEALHGESVDADVFS
jgi:Ca2+-binding RTX toxin-like protein